jgi:SAM-dependent MidA family methyltransferase
MKEALYHPTLGYYNRIDLQRWGREGDYRTSPERSELFAATFARHFVLLYEQLGKPAEFNIIEVGAGNGEFAAGILETLKRNFPSVLSAARYLVLETSQASRQVAAERLYEFRNQVQFVDGKLLQPVDSGILFTNELLDAFPVNRVMVRNGELKELFVSLNDNGKFVWVVDDPSSNEILHVVRNCLPPLREGQIVELNFGISDWFNTIEGLLRTGYLITVDYGAEAAELYSSMDRPNGTLRAFRRHEFVDDVLSHPGECDITCSIDWTFVKSEGKQHGFQVDQLSRLDRFLMQAGILDELEHRLSEAGSEAEKSTLTTAAREMILPGAMASSFQVLVQRR